MGVHDTIIEGTIVSGGQRLDRVLADASGLSRERIKALLGEGRITVGGKPVAQASLKPADGAAFRIDVPEAVAAEAQPQDIALDVTFEDAHLIVVDKPAGLVVHPAPGHESGTLVHALLARFPELRDPTGQMRPGIVHRLDKDTSGVMVVGKTPEAVAFLQRQMQAGKIHKRYRLLVIGTMHEEQGVIEAPIGRDRVNRQRMAVRPEGRSARTEFRVLERPPGFTYVDAGLPSGRTHQLRVHFAYIGHPVAADRTYGRGRAPGGLQRQFVHSHELTLTSPAGGGERTFVAELPPDLEAALSALRELANAERQISGERAS